MSCPYNTEHEFNEETDVCIECGAKSDPYHTRPEVQIDLLTGSEFVTIVEPEDAREVMEMLYRSEPEIVAFDVETTGFNIVNDYPHGFSVATEDMSWYFVNAAGVEAAKVFNRITHNNKTTIVAHNLKFDLHFIKKWGVTINPKQAMDTLLMAQMVDENQELALKSLAESWMGVYDLPDFGDLQMAAKKHLGVSRKDEVSIFDIPLGTLACYAARDTRLTYDLYVLLYEQLVKLSDKRLDNIKHLREEKIPFLFLLQSMEERGMFVDEGEWQKAYDYFSKSHTKAVQDWETLTSDIVVNLEEASFFPEPFTIITDSGERTVHNLDVKEVVNMLVAIDLTSTDMLYATELEQQLWVNEKIKRGKKLIGMAFPEPKGSDKAWKHMKAATYQVAPHNYNSNDQVANILFSPKYQGGFGLRPTATTPTGKPKLDGTNVTRLLRNYKNKGLATKLLELMTEIADSNKMLSTYLEPMKEARDSEGFVHAGLNQTGTVTGRLSSSKPLNLQNQPSVGERGKLIRSIFTAPPGYYVLVCDFSQLELRLLAHYSKSAQLIELFKQNGDPHALTAKLAGVERHVGKTINFAWAYGAWWKTIADTLEKMGYERPQKAAASKWLNDFDLAYPELVSWKEKVITYARQIKGIRTIAGRWRRLHNINSPVQQERGRAQRQAVNAIIQGSAGDIMERAMLDLRPWMSWFSSELVMQVHDEVVMYVPNKVAPEEIKPVVKETMENAGKYFGLLVPLLAEPNTGASWYEAK